MNANSPPQNPPLPTASLPVAEGPQAPPVAPRANGGSPQAAQQVPQAPQVHVEQSLPQGFVRRDTSKLMWSPRLSFDRKELLRGFVISKELLGFQGGMPWTAYLVKLTAPAPCEDRLGRPMIAPIGMEIFVQYESEFGEWDSYATNKDYCYEICVMPEARRHFENGLEAWTFLWGTGQQPAPRAQVHPKSAALLARISMVSGG